MNAECGNNFLFTFFETPRIRPCLVGIVGLRTVVWGVGWDLIGVGSFLEDKFVRCVQLEMTVAVT